MQPFTPSPFMQRAINAMVVVFQSGHLDRCITDRDAFFMMNESLGRDNRISYRTYQKYKSLAMRYGDLEIDEQGKFDPIFYDLYTTIYGGRLQQKHTLLGLMPDAEGKQLSHYHWLAERKFPELNIRAVTNKYIDEEATFEKYNRDADLAEMDREMNPEAYIKVPDNKPPKPETKAAMAIKEKQEEQEQMENFSIKVTDSSGTDWTEYGNQQQAQNDAEVNELPVVSAVNIAPPKPFRKPFLQMKEEDAQLQEMRNTLLSHWLPELADEERIEGRKLNLYEMLEFVKQMRYRDMRTKKSIRDYAAGTNRDEPEGVTETPVIKPTTSPLTVVRDNPEPTAPTDPWIKLDGTRLTNEEFVEMGKQRKAPLFPDRPAAPPKPPFKPTPAGVKKILGFI